MGPFILPTRMDIFCKRRLVFFSALTVINEELMLFFPLNPMVRNSVSGAEMLPGLSQDLSLIC